MEQSPSDLLTCGEDDWRIEIPGFTAVQEKWHESLFALANGCVGVRGALEERYPKRMSHPGTYLGGIYESQGTEPPTSRMVNLPNWLEVQLCLGDARFSLTGAAAKNVRSHGRMLDMRRGILTRSTEWAVGRRLTRIETARLVSMDDPHLCALEYRITPVNYSGRIRLVTGLDGSTEWQAGGKSWKVVRRRVDGNVIRLVVRTLTSQVTVAMAARVVLRAGGKPVECRLTRCSFRQGVGVEVSFPVERGVTYSLEKVVAIYSSQGADDPELAATTAAHQALDFQRLLSRHERQWRHYWDRADIQIKGDPQAQRAVRFAIFHLLQAASLHSPGLDYSIGAKGLTGEGYYGHVFWDTEIYMLPFLDHTFPEVTRGLLEYRFRRLSAARGNAQELGCRGAKFPWESAASGREDTVPWVKCKFTGRIIQNVLGEQQIHIVGDVPFAFWQHALATGDRTFLAERAAPVLCEAARFWASRAQRSLAADGEYHYELRNVTGPDENHESVNNNFFTNYLAAWNLRTALQVCNFLRGCSLPSWFALRDSLGLRRGEPDEWRLVADHLYIPFDQARGMHPQFDGFFDLRPVRVQDYHPDQGLPLDASEIQLLKQADTLLALHLFPELVGLESKRRHFHYYEPRTYHRSSLSPGMHALFAAEVGYVRKAYQYLLQAARVDLTYRPVENDEGLHFACLGSIWQAVVFGFAGVRFGDRGSLTVDPHLPRHWEALTFSLTRWGGQFNFSFRPGQVEVRALNQEVKAQVAGKTGIIQPGETVTFALPPAGEALGRPEEDLIRRPYKMVVFDWDGTVVPDRKTPVGDVMALLEEALSKGVCLVLVTGTHAGNIEAQFTAHVPLTLRRNLYLCCNRGSEVFTFDREGQMSPAFRRAATDEENKVMDEAAAEFAWLLKQRGVASAIISDRLNRRKVDILPHREVAKAQIGEALEEATRILARAGFSGIRDLTDLVLDRCRQRGLLPDLCVTSDVKHVELGLTDKSHSVQFVMEQTAPMQGLFLKDILFAGDEFGEVGGFPGSDSLMMKPPCVAGGVFVSVGKEPNGVPAGVIHWSTEGAKGFAEVLQMVLEAHQASL